MSRSLYIRYIEAIYLIHPWRGWTSCLSRQNTLRCGSLVRLDVIRHCCLTLLYDAGVLGRGRPEPAVAVLEPDDVLAPTGCGGRGLHQYGVLNGAQAVEHAWCYVHGVPGGQPHRAQRVHGVAEVHLDLTRDKGDRLVLDVVVLHREGLSGAHEEQLAHVRALDEREDLLMAPGLCDLLGWAYGGVWRWLGHCFPHRFVDGAVWSSRATPILASAMP